MRSTGAEGSTRVGHHSIEPSYHLFDQERFLVDVAFDHQTAISSSGDTGTSAPGMTSAASADGRAPRSVRSGKKMDATKAITPAATVSQKTSPMDREKASFTPATMFGIRCC